MSHDSSLYYIGRANSRCSARHPKDVGCLGVPGEYDLDTTIGNAEIGCYLENPDISNAARKSDTSRYQTSAREFIEAAGKS